MGDAGRELAKGGELFCLDETVLGRLQIPQRLFGSIARNPYCLFGALAFSYVGIDKYESAVRHRIAPHFDDPSVRTSALVTHLPSVSSRLRFSSASRSVESNSPRAAK